MSTMHILKVVCPECGAVAELCEVPKPGGIMQMNGPEPKEVVCKNGHTFTSGNGYVEEVPRS